MDDRGRRMRVHHNYLTDQNFSLSVSNASLPLPLIWYLHGKPPTEKDKYRRTRLLARALCRGFPSNQL